MRVVQYRRRLKMGLVNQRKKIMVIGINGMSHQVTQWKKNNQRGKAEGPFMLTSLRSNDTAFNLW